MAMSSLRNDDKHAVVRLDKAVDTDRKRKD